MQIHELNEFSGNPGPGTWYIVDSGTDTAKVNGGLLAYKTDVDVLEAQVADVITNNNGYKIETLWTGSAYTGDTTLSLSKAITNYDYLDFYAFISGIVQIYTVDATTGNLFVKGLNLTDDDSGKSVSMYEMKCIIDTQAVEIEFNHEWKWSGSSSASASKVSNPTACRLEKIVGRKCVVNQSDTEVLDIRVGADGTTYDSAGNAVRTQVSTLSGEIGNLGNLETTEKSNLVAAINEVKESGGGSGTGLTEGIKAALLQIAEKVAYIDEDGQDYYDALYSALYPPADLVSISAVYTQSGTVWTTDTLDSLKSDLVVTGLYDDQSTQVITTYTLSGTLEAGTSTITVSYGGKTTTFNVTVTAGTYPMTITATDAGVGFGSADNTKNTTTPPYVANANANRIHCIGDNALGFPVDPSKTYKISITSQLGTEYIGVMAFNETAEGLIENVESVPNTNKNDTGWQIIGANNNTYTYTPPATINNSPTSLMWINFKKDSGGFSAWSDITDSVFPITIEEI